MAFVPGQEGKRVRKGRGGQDQGLTESGMLTLQIPAHLPHQPRLPAQGGAPEAKSPLEEFHRGWSARASSPVCSSAPSAARGGQGAVSPTGKLTQTLKEPTVGAC